jgi:hypothetical protein
MILRIKDINGEWVTIPAIVGPQGEPGKDGKDGKDGAIVFEELTEEQKESLRGPRGPQGLQGLTGAPGKDYVLTSADKREIANIVVSSIADGEGVSY